MWIDAICINQSNLKEKGHQVALMGRVFSDARRVVVWLGNQSAKRALMILQNLVDLSLSFGSRWLHVPNWVWYDAGGRDSRIQEFTQLVVRLVRVKFFERPW